MHSPLPNGEKQMSSMCTLCPLCSAFSFSRLSWKEATWRERKPYVHWQMQALYRTVGIKVTDYVQTSQHPPCSRREHTNSRNLCARGSISEIYTPGVWQTIHWSTPIIKRKHIYPTKSSFTKQRKKMVIHRCPNKRPPRFQERRKKNSLGHVGTLWCSPITTSSHLSWLTIPKLFKHVQPDIVIIRVLSKMRIAVSRLWVQRKCVPQRLFVLAKYA